MDPAPIQQCDGEHLEAETIKRILRVMSLPKLVLLADQLEAVASETQHGDVTLVVVQGRVELVKRTISYK